MIAVDDARRMLEACKGKRILVVGDLMLDRYVRGIVQRISPEAPVPVLKVTAEDARPGGAANVALNINALGGSAAVCGIVGDDAAGEELVQRLEDSKVDVGGIIRSGESGTIVKTRVIAEHQQVVRVDREGNGISPEMMARLLKRLEAGLRNPDGVILEDYGKGLLCQHVIDAACDAGTNGDFPVGLDPKDNSDLRLQGLTVATPNYREACIACGVRERMLDEEADLAAHVAPLAEQLCRQWDSRQIMITLGAHGLFLHGQNGESHLIPARAREVFDVSGAGDTVIAVTLLALAAGESFLSAATLANYAAGVVVGKLGTAVCGKDDLLEYIGSVV